MPDGLSFPRVPNHAAIAAIERRGGNFTPSGYWYEVWEQAHQTAFTVAQSAGFDILKDIYDALHTAMSDGVPFAQFRRELTPILQKKGWWGKSEDGRQLGAPWRLKTIYNQNLRVSAAQGDWERFQAMKESRPWLRYTALLDGRTRPLHASWHGLILPLDHPWWDTHFPPNGWNCRCKALSVGPETLKLYGWQVSENAPDDGMRIWENPATGEKIEVPNGIDPGWAYNPGKISLPEHAAKTAMEKLLGMEIDEEIAALGKTIVRVANQALRTSLGRMVVADIVARGLAKWMEKPRQPFPLAVLSWEDAQSIGSFAQIAKLSSETFEKQKSHHPELTESDYALALEAVEEGEKIQDGDKNLIYVLNSAEKPMVVVKSTRYGNELYITSLRRMSRDGKAKDKVLRRLRNKSKKTDGGA